MEIDLLNEDGTLLLQETGDNILLEQSILVQGEVSVTSVAMQRIIQIFGY